MTHKDRMLAAITGRPTDRIPWAPRLDLWYRANRLAGTLPPKHRNASLMELVDDLGIGFHAVVPNFRDLRSAEDDADRALGIFNLHTMPYRTELENVRREVRIDGDRTIVTYKTPVGDISTVVLYDDSMRKAGISITHVAKHAFQMPQDYAPLGYIFENARVLPNDEGYSAFAAHVGERGLAVGYVSLAASPMHLIQRELMQLDTFFYETHDRPDQMNRLARQIGAYWDRVFEVTSQTRAELIFLGANYDATVTYPPFFEEHIMPWLKKYSELLRPKGKYLLTHTDGENTGLLQHYVSSGIDVADSICPKPMTKLSFKEVRDVFAGRITIMGGIPSVALLRSSMSDRDFEAFLDAFFEQIGRGDHLILGISDTTPPQAEFSRILKIRERVEAFGAVRPSSTPERQE